ncbi:MAG TPA: hypothetical protein VHN20_17555, partial [Beijerinckiaceae bacterium]|nr:hypothetical protein [Beijerinckiaceae bacterium]
MHRSTVRVHRALLLAGVALAALAAVPAAAHVIDPAARQAQLPGGGGIGPVELEGLRNARVFDPRTRSWSQAQHMHYGRWYPSGVRLPDGQVMAFGGVTKLVKNNQLINVKQTETFNPRTGTWTEHDEDLSPTASLPLYPRLHLMPNGKVFYAGNGQNWGPFGQSPESAAWALQRFYDLKTHRWQVVGPAPAGV